MAAVVGLLLVGVESVRGVYQLARGEDEVRLSTYRHLLSVAFDAEVAKIAGSVERIAADRALGSAADGETRGALERRLAENSSCFDALAIVDTSGGVLVSVPETGVPSRLPVTATESAGAAEGVRFLHEPAKAGSATRGLWVLRAVPGGLLVAARVDTDYLFEPLGGVASVSGGSVVLIVDGQGDVIAAAGPSAPPAAEALRMAPAKDGRHGEAVGKAAAGDPLSGFYDVVSTTPDLGWRVVVLESSDTTFAAVRAALLPAALVAVVAICLGVLSVLIYGRRVTQPLAAFERRAREIASGGYVRPMLLRRDDELGRLAEAFNAMGVRLNSLQDTAQLLASTSRTDDLLDAVLSATGHLLGTTDAAVLIANEEATMLSLARGRGIRDPDSDFTIRMDEQSPITGAFRERLAQTFEGSSTPSVSSVFRLFDAAPDRSGVAVPLVAGQHVLGVVVALSAGRHPLTEAHVETLRAFCAQAAVALHTSRLFQHERSSRTEAEALREAAEIVAGTTDLDDTLGKVTAIAADILGMRSEVIAMEDRETFGLPDSTDPDRERVILDMWRWAIAARAEQTDGPEPILLPAHDTARPGLHPEGAMLLIPLVRDEAVKGVLALTGEEGVLPGRREIATAGALGRQLSLALENAALLREARTKAANLETVFRISQAVSSSLQISVVLNRVLDVVQKIFSADAVALMSFDPKTRHLVTTMARGIANREMLYFQVLPGEDIPGIVFESRDPAWHADLATVDTPLARLAFSQGLRSLVAVPLLARGRSTGALVVYDNRPDAFSREDVELLLTFASQAAIAIDTAGLYSKEHHVASILQASILPARSPRAPGLDIDGFYLPASSEAEIGGDFYDAVTARDGTVAVAIGDVCGKGVLAATKTSMIKYTLQGMAFAGAGPAEILGELNRIVSATGDPADILTAWVGHIDPDRRVLRYADAGHPPALLKRASARRFERLTATGPLLGGVPSAVYEERIVPVGPEDLLVTYTDGVTEARKGRRLFGEGRIRRVLLHSSTAGEAVEGLLESLNTFTSGAMRDDAAALAVRVVEDERGRSRVRGLSRRVDSDQSRSGQASVADGAPGQ